jgi:hypothetical protein
VRVLAPSGQAFRGCRADRVAAGRLTVVADSAGRLFLLCPPVQFLKRSIQEGTHDSAQDAKAAMDLALLKIRKGVCCVCMRLVCWQHASCKVACRHADRLRCLHFRPAPSCEVGCAEQHARFPAWLDRNPSL